MRLSLAAVALLLVGVGAVIVALVAPSFAASPSISYLTAAVVRQTVVKSVAATGQVVPSATYALSFGSPPRLVLGTSGSAAGSTGDWLVTEVDVVVGQAVREGEALAKADTSDLEVQLEIATNNWRAARNQLASAQADLDSATTTNAKRQATIALYNAQAQVSQAQRTRSQLTAQIAAATIRAPADGIVTSVSIREGVLAPSGDAIVIETGPFEVTAQVAERDVGSLAVGQPVTVVVDGLGVTLNGRVTAVAPAASSSGGSSVVAFPVTISLDDPPAGLAAGMSATVSIETARAEGVLAVPITALNGTGADASVEILDATDQPVRRPVEVGLIGDEFVEIRGGVSEGERVVIGSSTSRQTVTPGGFGIGFPGGFRGGGGSPNR